MGVDARIGGATRRLDAELGSGVSHACESLPNGLIANDRIAGPRRRSQPGLGAKSEAVGSVACEYFEKEIGSPPIPSRNAWCVGSRSRVAFLIDEDLGLVLEPPKRARVQHTVAVALKIGAVGVCCV